VIGAFTVTALDLTGGDVKLAQVEYTWDGEGITINQDDFKLYTEETVNGKTVKNYIDSSLYKVTALYDGTHTISVDSKTNRATGENIKPGTFYAVIEKADSTNQNVTVTEGDGKIENAVKVNKANWSDAVITFGDQTDDSTTNVTVTLNGHKLTGSRTHYTATSEEYGSGTGIAKVTVTPVDDYFATGSKAVVDYVNIGTDISKYIKSATLKDTTTSYTYTGEEIKPEVTITPVKNVTLTEGVDYEVVYTSNVDKGTATITVKGLGTYAGEAEVDTFTITAAKLSDATVTAEDVTYETTLPTVADLAKALTIKNGNTTLVYGEDFNVVGGTVKEGENTLRIAAVAGSNYTGITTATVNVVKVADISTAEIATIANVAYTGEAQTPALKVTLGDKELVAGTDYTVAYTNNTEVGKATATITGIGAYTGTNERNFVIVPQQVTGLKAVKKTATTLKLQFNAVEGADGYKIYDAETGKAIASVSTQNGADVLKKTITGLNAGETRKYKVRAYKIVNGTKRYAEYSAVYTKATAKK
jgi:hypothetical protein